MRQITSIHDNEPDEATHNLDDLYRWHGCGARRRMYVWVTPKKAGGVFHCQGCKRPGRCVACADEQRRPLAGGTIPLLCRLHAGLLPDESEAAIEVGLAWPSWKTFPLTPLLDLPLSSLVPALPAQLSLFA